MRPRLRAALCLCVLAAGCAPGAYRTARDEFEHAHRPIIDEAGQPKLPELGPAATLPDYLEYAALRNPGLEAAFCQWKAALERIPQATALPDPRFTYRYFIREVETRVGPQRHGVAVAQTFPWFGKLARRGGVALEAARVAQQQYEAAKWKLFYRVRNVYSELYYLGRAITIVRENRDLVQHLEQVARARYKTAAGRHQDVIRAQVELGKLEDRLAALEELHAPIAARLNAALNRPVDAPVPLPKRLPAATKSASDEQVLAWLRTASPELKALEHEIARERQALALARKNYFPDLTFGLDYIVTGGAKTPVKPSDSGKDPVIAMVSINLPIWIQKYRAAEREAQARLRAAIQAKAERANTLSSDTKMILYRLRDAERKVGFYGDTLLPKAIEALKATETAFRAGKASFLDLVDAERMLLEFQLSQERARTDRSQRRAELEMLIGRPLSAAEGDKP